MRKESIEAKNKKDAINKAPWAAKVKKVEGGYMCFESVEDYKIWDNQK